MLPNCYGVSIARWYIDGVYYGPDREPIPDHIAAMDNEEQAAIALENYKEQERIEAEQMRESEEAERRREEEILAENKRRKEEELEAEIERRAELKAQEKVQALLADQEAASLNGDEGNQDKKEQRTEELTDILAGCTTKDELHTKMKSVPWQNIQKAVEGLGLEKGEDKTANIEILAGHLGLE
jgi:hypothetical protein